MPVTSSSAGLERANSIEPVEGPPVDARRIELSLGRQNRVRRTNIRLPAAVTGCDSASEPGLVPALGERIRFRPESAVWKGDVCDDRARCGLHSAFPDHSPPEEH